MKVVAVATVAVWPSELNVDMPNRGQDPYYALQSSNFSLKRWPLRRKALFAC